MERSKMDTRGVTGPLHTDSARREHLERHHERTLWVYWFIILLGFWLVLSPFTFSYGKNVVAPSGGRALWLTDAARIYLMQWSDLICGCLLIIFGAVSLKPNRPVALWFACFVGVWLNVAPIVFWAPSAFGDSSMQVLNSDMSHSLPVSDAAVGALTYTFEFLMGWMGGVSRWRTMPWMVTVFGILVVPLGLVHIILVISQPVIVGEWCTFCLLAAAIMLPMIPLEIDEVVAMVQHLVQARKRGDNMWTVFWKGGEPFEKNTDTRTIPLKKFSESPLSVIKSSLWGMYVPLNLGVTTVLGIALMFVPGIAGISIETHTADLFHIAGTLTVVVSVISMGEVARALRYLNLIAATTLIAVPWFLAHASYWISIAGVVGGVAIGLLSIRRGKIRERYGFWDRFIV